MTFPIIYKTYRTQIRILYLSLALTGASLKASSNDSLSFINDLNLSARINYGYIYPHHNAIQYLLQERITGFEICLTTQSYGRTIYDKLYRYPRLGIGFLHTSLGNDKIFGKGNALFLLMDFTIVGQKSRLSLNYGIDFGAGYLNKQFDAENNLMNIAISTPINFFGGLNCKLNYRFDDRNEVNAGFKMYHFSNGKLGTPNLGLNAFAVSLGYNYRIKPFAHARREYLNNEPVKRHFFELGINAGAKADDQLSEKHYFISSLVFDYMFFPKYKYGFGAGSDVFYDQALGPNKTADLGVPYSNADLYQAGVHAGVYARYSKLTIVLQVGDYLYATYCKYASFYSRLGFRYSINDHILLNLTLKSHYAIADFVEWGLVYRF